MNMEKLKQYLKKYNSWSCPSNFYLAWRILFDNAIYPNKEEILKDAMEELEDLENSRSQSIFEKGRFKGKDILKFNKYNW